MSHYRTFAILVMICLIVLAAAFYTLAAFAGDGFPRGRIPEESSWAQTDAEGAAVLAEASPPDGAPANDGESESSDSSVSFPFALD